MQVSRTSESGSYRSQSPGVILPPGDPGPALETSVVVTTGSAPVIQWLGAGNAVPPPHPTVPSWQSHVPSAEMVYKDTGQSFPPRSLDSGL